MTRPNRSLAAGVAAALLLGAGPAAAEPYHNDKHGFSLDLPASWRPLTPKEMKAVNAVARQAWRDDEMTFVAGFRDTDGDLESAPYLFVHIDTDLAGMSFEHFEKEFARGVAAARRRDSASGRRGFRLAFSDDPTFDRERKRVTCRSRVNASAGSVAGYSVGYLRKDGLYVLDAFCPASHFDAQVPAFEAITGSFQTDDDKAATGAESLGKLFGVDVGENGKMWIVGGGVALLVFAIGTVALRAR